MKVLVLSSGGIDSTTALGMAVNKYGKENVISLSVSYGQKHNKELTAANEVAKFYGIEQLFLDLAKYLNIAIALYYNSQQKKFQKKVIRNR